MSSSTLPTTTATSRTVLAPDSVVRLVSVDEDSFGEELEVVWSLEPGRRIDSTGSARLPTPEGFDDPADLAAFLDAVRWGSVSSADPRTIQSPFRSGITIEDYQLEPVVRAIQMPRANLLIADDVGLGKTIEAGLVAQELLLRHRIRSILIVCPSSLQIKWRDEMHQKFGLDFEIVDSSLMKRLRRNRGLHVNPWTHYPRLITSMDYVKREGPIRLFRATLPRTGEPLYPRRYGLLIVDEAHNVAPAGRGKYDTSESDRTVAIRTIAPHFEHKLFLSATPHNGHPESFAALLNLLDDQRFARSVRRHEPELVEPVLVRRLKSELKDEQGNPRYHPRELVPLDVPYTTKEKDAYRDLVAYGGHLREASGSGRGMACEFILKLLKKRFFSSPRAFADTLAKHAKTLRGIEEEEPRSRRRQPQEGILKRMLQEAERDSATDTGYEARQDDAMAQASRAIEDLSDEGRSLLQRLQNWAEVASQRRDTKAGRLLRFLDDICRPDGEWNDERVIVFTEYRSTQKWLVGLLASAGYRAQDRLEILYGGMDEDERESIKNAFQAHPSKGAVRVLLATDMASEGIDLQNHCHRMVHYEIPWNPSRLEQRCGRIDRHGQKKAPLIHHFVGSGFRDQGNEWSKPGDLEGDLEFLAVVARKISEMERDLHGRVNPVIARQVNERMLGDRTELDTRAAETGEDAKTVRRILSFRHRLGQRIRELREGLDLE